MELLIGNKNYSTWSLRGWLMLKAWDIPFNEHQYVLDTDDFRAQLAKYPQAAGMVPLLIDNQDGDELLVWDSLAICEYINEQYLDGKGWPANAAARARARSVAAEMHSGFNAIRNELPMNLRAQRKVELSAAAHQNIARINQLWTELREQYKAQGPYLFGEFSIVDVMFAPVVFRFPSYGITLQPLAEQYAQTLRSHPAMQLWLELSKLETDIVEKDEAGEPVA
ncbi:glutathione S-transferase family protein [Oceanobacter mangrovi]|uniref:glutathione S-transferase family protein n=1 Tax=Oceanobacter mangrovi TaxID=2862510 RepID=UPI001C8D5EEE|nr:glutathione S-transferase family protein [Oceanobacter mangrovi]